MTKLYLKFKDEKGADRTVSVEGERFVIGRHPGNDLCIPDARLSRQHVKIERFGDIFVVSDCGSSNGTTLNGANLSDPVALKNEDKLNLGGDLEIRVELVSDDPRRTNRRADGASGDVFSDASASGGTSIPNAVFIIGPILALVMLTCGGGLLYVLGGKEEPGRTRNDDYNFSTPEETPEKTKSPAPSSSVEGPSNGKTSTPVPEDTDEPATPEADSEAKKIEQNSSAFLRRIALNDPNAFLTAAQIEMVSAKIAPLKGSAALAENFKAVKANASQFESLAKSEGLTPQFLAAAALAQIGNSQGNPLETAKSMLPVLGGLRISLANNLGDDNLLIIAAFNQGKAGKFRDLRNVLEGLAKKNPSVSPREIRTIWFLKKQNKLTDAEFEFALRFLAIGTITQNPKDFNVNSEAVIFN